jgi:choline kinase
MIANADLYYTQELLDRVFNINQDNFLLSDVTRAQVGDYFFYSENGILKKYGKELKPEERNSEYVGIACLRGAWVKKFKKRLVSLIEDGKYNTWWESVLYSFVGEEDIHTADVNGIFWSEVDTIDDYHRVLNYAKKNNG